VKFFVWLFLLDRLNTKDMLFRRHFKMQTNSLCVLCKSGAVETIEHLFFDCDFAQRCWSKLSINWSPDAEIQERILNTRSAVGLPFFMEIFNLAAWELWKIRNRMISYGVRPSFNRWIHNFKAEASLQAH
jgi:hypothetical protein